MSKVYVTTRTGRNKLSMPGSASFFRDNTKGLHLLRWMHLYCGPWAKLVKCLNSLKTKVYVVKHVVCAWGSVRVFPGAILIISTAKILYCPFFQFFLGVELRC